MIVLQAIIVIIFLALLVLGFLRRNMPRVGGNLARSGPSVRHRRRRADFHGSMAAR
jgi:hypothetical protein